MNAPVMQGLNLNAPSYVKNPKLIAWVADMAALTKPAAIYWCDGSDEEYQRLCQQLVDGGTFKLNPAKRPNSFTGLLRPQRRGPRGRPHCLLREEKCRAHQQLDGSRRRARPAANRQGRRKKPCSTAA